MKQALFAGLVGVLVAGVPASAQLMLPGALHTRPPEGAGKGPPAATDGAPAGGKPKPAPARQAPPADATILGRELARDGSAGSMVFASRAPGRLEIARLSLAGEEISRRGALCRVDVVAGEPPIEARYTGRPEGLARYEVEIEACPFSFDILDGAVLVARSPRACDFVAADCRVEPTGLWGPPPQAFDAKQIKQLEQARARVEATMRANFRALLASAGKDKEAIKKIAGEQAGFSSVRTVACRDYAGEDEHGFCALRMTEARAFALQARHEAAAHDRAGSKPDRAALDKKPAP